MSENVKGSIGFKILIGILFLALFYILSMPPKIWQEQNVAMNQEKRDMKSIYQAEKLYKYATGKYTLDFDEVAMLIKNDTSLTVRQRVTEATQGLYSKLGQTLENDMLLHLLEVADSYRDMISDFEDPEKMSDINRQMPGLEVEQAALLEIADSLYRVLGKIKILTRYENEYHAIVLTKELAELYKGITDDRLSMVALKASYLSDTLLTALPNFDPNRILEFFTEQTAPLVKTFGQMFFDLGINQRSAFAERTIGFQAQIEYSLNAINDMDVTARKEEFSARAAEIEALYNIMLNDYTDLLDLYGKLYLSPEDSLLTEFSQSSLESKMVMGEKYVVETDTGGIFLAIESPVMLTQARESVNPVLEAYSGIELTDKYVNLFAAIDSLSPVIQENLQEFRDNVKYRDDRRAITGVTLELKTLIVMLRNVKSSPFIQHGYELIEARENTANETRYSKIQDGLENTAKLMVYFKSLVDSGKVEIINGILDDIKRDAAKIDTMFMDVKFRRSSVEWQSLNSNFTDAISALKKIVSTLQSERDKYDELSGLAVDIFETNSEGDTEFHGLIFPISIKNPGYIEGNVVSWGEKDK